MKTLKNIRIIAAFGIVLTCFSCVRQQPAESLFRATSIPVGSAVRFETLMDNDTIQKILIEQFSSMTLRREMKMSWILPEQSVYKWGCADSTAAFCRQHEKRFFGHTLIWHSSTPDWILKTHTDSASLALFTKDYIQKVVSRYKDIVDGWDVVNEPILDKTGQIRPTHWYELMGESYFDLAFHAAHAADPDAILFLNDYNIERDTAKLTGFLDLVGRLKDRGVPISGIGMQMHLRMDIPNDVIAHSFKKVAETGLQVHLSEVDIIFNQHGEKRGGGIQIYNELTKEMELAQQEKYREIVKMYRQFVPAEQQYGITLWGFDDRTTWIKSAFAIEDWPCLYDSKFNKKPAYFGFLKGLTDKL